jgi:hypothetical protein
VRYYLVLGIPMGTNLVRNPRARVIYTAGWRRRELNSKVNFNMPLAVISSKNADLFPFPFKIYPTRHGLVVLR